MVSIVSIRSAFDVSFVKWVFLFVSLLNAVNDLMTIHFFV